VIIYIDLIRPNRFQPRMRFKEDELEELSNSIQEQGILQPLLVRKQTEGYELIAGERRLRAAKMAGFAQVPVVIKRISDSKLLEMSIVENIQRENFNPIEEAEAYHRLITEFDLTQDQAASRVGKSRSAVANFLRLRQLPEPIKETIIDGTLSMGHARALLGVEVSAQQNAAWRAIVSKRLSVRQTEDLIRRLKSEKKRPQVTKKSPEDRYLSDLAEELSRYFGTKVVIRKFGQRGKLEIEFYSNDDLNRLIELLKSK
jgi:ParB family chromosome partitioning protein